MTNSLLWSRGVRACSVAWLIIQSSCMTSPPPRRIATADTHRGVSVIVHMIDGPEYYGELLAVRDSSIVVLTRNRIAIGSFADIRGVTVGEFAPTDFTKGWWPLETSLGKLAPASRFPYGIAASPMAMLLESTKQTAPADLRAFVP